MSERPKAVVDTCVILSILLNEEDRAEKARCLIANIGSANLVLPAISKVELYAHPRNRVADSLDADVRLDAYHKLGVSLHKFNIKIVELSEYIADTAAKMCAKYNIKAPDATVLASAKCLGIDTVYTFDKKLINAFESYKDASDTFVVRMPPSAEELDQLPLWDR